MKIRRNAWTKRQWIRAYVAGDVTLSPALAALMLDFGMERGEALKALGL